MLAAFACTLGTLPHLVAALTGLAALLQASGLAFQTLKYLGVAYLLCMAWGTWRDHGALSVDVDVDVDADGTRNGLAPPRDRVSGVTINLLNPKLTLFFFAFLPQFVPAGTSGRCR